MVISHFQPYRKLGVEVRVRGVTEYQTEDVAWADAVMSLGGVRCIRVLYMCQALC